MRDLGLHEHGNGTFDPDRVLAARSVALREAVRESAALAGLHGGGRTEMTEELAARLRARALQRAEALEAWLLRPLGDEDGDEYGAFGG